MKIFNYIVININGSKIKGTIEANDLNDAKRKLSSKKYKIIEIKERKQSSFSSRKKEFKLDKISHFCRQFSIIISSGINNIVGLETMVKKEEDKLFALEIQRMIEDIRSGSTISESMLKEESKMPKLLGTMILIGEETGSLESVLKSMYVYYERENKINQKIKNASTYPMIIGILSLIILFIFTSFIIPKMMENILAVGGELPLITKMIMGLGEFMGKYWWLVIIVFYILFYITTKYMKTSSGRILRDKVIDRIPLLGKGVKSIVSMRFCRTLYLFVSTGYPIMQGLEYIKSTLNNSIAEKSISEAKEGLMRGEALSDGLAKNEYFDPILIQMVIIGERTGQLESITKEMAEFYEAESDVYITRLMSMIEPILIIIVGIIVAIIVIALFLPMVRLYDSL